MDIQKLREVITWNISLDANDDLAQEKCWKEMIDILSFNIYDTINYIKNDCTDEEFFWISSVFDDVAEITQSKDFVQAVRNRLSKITRENYHQTDFKSEFMRKWVDYDEYIRSVGTDIEFAEKNIPDEE